MPCDPMRRHQRSRNPRTSYLPRSTLNPVGPTLITSSEKASVTSCGAFSAGHLIRNTPGFGYGLTGNR